ncbi:hypothetical protein EYF80_051998 [Liparis tanakae]|uniref:Uncharacterized protein n=1 Tax=Liparis tanakae TaxID=230148 RepID=A0A4Z2F9J1_9TELE|nr:hypothetical protein EYF80_051998 [Liparis tanakae]
MLGGVYSRATESESASRNKRHSAIANQTGHRGYTEVRGRGIRGGGEEEEERERWDETYSGEVERGRRRRTRVRTEQMVLDKRDDERNDNAAYGEGCRQMAVSIRNFSKVPTHSHDLEATENEKEPCGARPRLHYRAADLRPDGMQDAGLPIGSSVGFSSRTLRLVDWKSSSDPINPVTRVLSSSPPPLRSSHTSPVRIPLSFDI